MDSGSSSKYMTVKVFSETFIFHSVLSPYGLLASAMLSGILCASDNFSLAWEIFKFYCEKKSNLRMKNCGKCRIRFILIDIACSCHESAYFPLHICAAIMNQMNN